jgi:hypothetical protein
MRLIIMWAVLQNALIYSVYTFPCIKESVSGMVLAAHMCGALSDEKTGL